MSDENRVNELETQVLQEYSSIAQTMKRVGVLVILLTRMFTQLSSIKCVKNSVITQMSSYYNNYVN